MTACDDINLIGNVTAGSVVVPVGICPIRTSGLAG
jgi:hypothetical protein